MFQLQALSASNMKNVLAVETFYPKGAILDMQDFEILGWCPAGPVLLHGEKVPL